MRRGWYKLSTSWFSCTDVWRHTPNQTGRRTEPTNDSGLGSNQTCVITGAGDPPGSRRTKAPLEAGPKAGSEFASCNQYRGTLDRSAGVSTCEPGHSYGPHLGHTG